MLSETFYKLWNAGILQRGIWETIYMTAISTAISYVIGLPLGVVLNITDREGIYPVRWLNRLLGVIVNFFRSIPFIILMVAMLPVANFIVGTSLGNKAMIVMLVIAASPYIARMVESSLKEVSFGVIEAAQSMGANNFQIVTKVLLPEAKPSLIMGAVIWLTNQLGRQLYIYFTKGAQLSWSANALILVIDLIFALFVYSISLIRSGAVDEEAQRKRCFQKYYRDYCSADCAVRDHRRAGLPQFYRRYARTV